MAKKQKSGKGCLIACLALLFVGIFLFLPHIISQIRINSELRSAIDKSVEELEDNPYKSYDQNGYVTVIEFDDDITEKTLQKKLSEVSPSHQSNYYVWDWKGLSSVTASAQGTDRLHHFVNSYLIGYMPFETDKPWIPLYIIASRKKYQFDYLQYSGFMDVWQNSYEAYYFTRGDCEDHAMILADWLIGIGIDARVVVGDRNEQGHAWVVMTHDNKDYVLEATDKSKIKNVKHYPLAQLINGYHPKFQFNRKQFWANTGSQYTRDYSGSHWALRSEFTSTAGN